MSQFTRELRRLRLSPESGLSDDAFVAKVMLACEQPERRELAKAEPRRWSRAVGLFAAVAVLALCVGRASRVEPSTLAISGELAARGAGAPRKAATVQAFVGRAVAGKAAALLEGAELSPGDGIVVRYSNPTPRDAYLMVFALDSKRDVHWLHPAYLDESSNPSSLRLAQQVEGRTLDEVAEPEHPAPGALRVFALLTEAPLAVKAVEARLAAAQAPVRELFPQAEVEEWSCTWRDR